MDCSGMVYKLRNFAKHFRAVAYSGAQCIDYMRNDFGIDPQSSYSFDMAVVLEMIVDTIERYCVCLPVDKDGEPVNPGDKLYTDSGREIGVTSVGTHYKSRVLGAFTASSEIISGINEMTKTKPRTLDDIKISTVNACINYDTDLIKAYIDEAYEMGKADAEKAQETF